MFTIAIDLVSATLIGLFFGLYLDKWLGTKPLCLIVCLTIGFIAGFKNIMKGTKDDSSQPPGSV